MGVHEEDFSTLTISPKLLSQIVDSLKNKAYGSVEIYIENFKVTQITERTITKLAKKTANKSQDASVQADTKFSQSIPTNQ